MEHNWYKEQRTVADEGTERMYGKKQRKVSMGEKTKERREVRFSPSPKFLVYLSARGESSFFYLHPGNGGKVSF
jgi:hypothetical protein